MRVTKHLNKSNTEMSKVDQYKVIKWVNQLMETIEETKGKLHNVGVLLARHKAGVDGLIDRDLQQRTLNKIVEQKIGLRLNEKTQHLYMTECRSIRKELSRNWYAGKRWVEDNQITDKEERLDKGTGQRTEEHGHEDVEHTLLRVGRADSDNALAVFNIGLGRAFVELHVELDEFHGTIGSGRHGLHRRP